MEAAAAAEEQEQEEKEEEGETEETQMLFLLLLLSRQEEEEEEEEGFPALSSSSSSSYVLHRLIHLSRSPSQRAFLAAQSAVPRLLPLLTLNLSRFHTLILLLKLLRNLCAGEPSNQQSFLDSDGVSCISFMITEILKGKEKQEPSKEEDSVHVQEEKVKAEEEKGKENEDLFCSVLQISLQLLGNVCAAGEAQREAVWICFFPTKLRTLVSIAKEYGKLTVTDPLCMIIYTCSHGVRDRLMDLCHGEGAMLVFDCIGSFNGDDGALAGGSSHWISSLLSELCLQEPLLPHLFTHLGRSYRLSSCTAEFSEKQSKTSFCTEQVTLLGYVMDLLEDELKEDTFVTKDMQLPLPRETILYLKDVIQVSSKEFQCENIHGMSPSMVDVLRKSLELFKILVACEHGFRYSIATELLSIGFIRLCLELLKDLGPPELIQNAIEKHGEAEWTTRNGCLNLSKSNNPYKGYRKDIVAILANVSYKNRFVQDEIRNLGGLPLILQQCVIDEENPFLREWGFWAVRNLLDNNLDNVKEISEMQLKGLVTPVELEQKGYKLEMDQAIGRPKLVNVSSLKED